MFLSGASFCLIIFSRTSFLLWIPVLIPVVLVRFAWKSKSNGSRWKQSLQWTLLFLAVVLLTQSPWWIRNRLVLERFQPLGTKGSTTLVGGYCSESVSQQGEWQFDPERGLRAQYPPPVDSDQAREWIDNELVIAKAASEQVKTWTFENLSSLPILMVQRIVTEWNPYTGKALALKLLAAVGIVGLAIRDRRALVWVGFPLVIQSLVTASTYSVGGRFLVPVFGCLYLLALLGFAEGCRLVWKSYSICFSSEGRPSLTAKPEITDLPRSLHPS